MPNILIGLLGGLVLGIFFGKYLFSYLDILFEVFTAKQSEIITYHNLNIQIMNCDVLRDYPELNNGGVVPEQTNIVGFKCYPPTDEYEDDYYEEDKLKNKLRNKLKSKNKGLI